MPPSTSTCRSASGRRSRRPLTDEEQADLADMGRFTRDEAAYANEQGTKPQTVGVGLDDSPAGLLAWIVEKFRGWSDCDGDPENCFTRDQLLTNVMLYWLTRTATSSARLYWETNRSGVLTERLPFIEVPTGVARYPKEVLRWPRSWVERAVQRHPVGDHAPGWPLRRHGAARAVRRRRAGVLPDRALTRPPVGGSTGRGTFRRRRPMSGAPALQVTRSGGLRRSRGTYPRRKAPAPDRHTPPSPSTTSRAIVGRSSMPSGFVSRPTPP